VAVHKIDKVERHQVTINNTKIPLSEAFRQNLTALLSK
jgi:hypothetical protein